MSDVFREGMSVKEEKMSFISILIHYKQTTEFVFT